MTKMLYTIVLNLCVVKTVAFWRWMISLMRGCCQLPGLSVIGGGMGLYGVWGAPDELRDLLSERGVMDDILSGRRLPVLAVVDEP